MKGNKHTSAPEYTFHTDNEQAIKKLLIEMSDLFHKITAHILLVQGTSKRGRSYLKMETSLICTRARSCNESDYKKLQHSIHTTDRKSR